MRYSLGIFLRRAMGLTATLILATALPVQAAPAPDQAVLHNGSNASQTGTLLLAQAPESPQEKPSIPPAPPKEQKKLKTMGVPPPPQMERMEKSVIRDEPGKAGTKKLGGQTIRAKETPGGE